MLTRIFIYVTAFLLPPILLGTISTFSTLSSVMIQKQPEALEASSRIPAPPALTHKLKAAILMSNRGSQITDVLAPFELLAASDAFDVYTVANARTLSPTTAPLGILPHYSFSDAPKPDLLVIPAILESGQTQTLNWIRESAKTARLTLSVCEGARAASEAGLFRKHRGTSHFLAIDSLKDQEPQAEWITNARTVIDRGLLSTAGVTASLDGTLIAIEKLAGKEALERALRQTGYKSSATSPEERGSFATAKDFAQIWLRAGFDLWRDRVAVLVYPGVSEIGLAAALDTFARTQSVATFTMAPKREVIRTAHGLDVVPAEAISMPIRAELLWIPEGTQSRDKPESFAAGILAFQTPETQAWLSRTRATVKNFALEPPGKAYDRALSFLAEKEGLAITDFVAKMIEHPGFRPVTQKSAQASDWPFRLWIRPLLIGLLGLAIGIGMERRFRKRRLRLTHTPRKIAD